MSDERNVDAIEKLLDLSYLVKSAGLQQQRKDDRQLRFGDVAVKKRFARRRQVNTALAIQRRDHELGRPHRRVGQILVETGVMTQDQVRVVMRELTKKTLAERRRRSRTPGGTAWSGPLVAPL